MTIYVIIESAEYDSGDLYSDVVTPAFKQRERAEEAIAEMQRNPPKHKYSKPIFHIEEIEVV